MGSGLCNRDVMDLDHLDSHIDVSSPGSKLKNLFNNHTLNKYETKDFPYSAETKISKVKNDMKGGKK